MKRISKILVGCLVILIILAILGVIFSGVIIKKIITGAIREKTGVQVSVDDLNKGKLSYTDPKTGQTLNIGENKIPDNFPKDFPIYPGSTPTVSLSGSQGSLWLTLTTSDSKEKAISFYQENLSKNSWNPQTTKGTNASTSWIVSKNNLSGYLTVTTTYNQTSILIVLGEETPIGQ